MHQEIVTTLVQKPRCTKTQLKMGNLYMMTREKPSWWSPDLRNLVIEGVWVQSSSSQQARRPNTKHMVVLRIGEIKISSGGGNLWLCTAVLGGDHFTPNMEAADNVLTSPLWWPAPLCSLWWPTMCSPPPLWWPGYWAPQFTAHPCQLLSLAQVTIWYLQFTTLSFQSTIYRFQQYTIQNLQFPVYCQKTLPLPEL